MSESNFFSYTQTCPECSKLNLTSHLGFDSGTGLIRCDGENPHTFDALPGESAPAAEADARTATSEFASEARVSEEPLTADEVAALDEAMQHDPRPRDFSHMVTEPADEVAASEIVAPEATGTQGEAIPYPMPDGVEIDGSTLMLYNIAKPSVDFGDSPRLGLGEVIVLPNGDAFCGVRIEEKWVSGMQSEAETQGKTFGEYFQELLSDSLIQWYSSVPGVR